MNRSSLRLGAVGLAVLLAAGAAPVYADAAGERFHGVYAAIYQGWTHYNVDVDLPGGDSMGGLGAAGGVGGVIVGTGALFGRDYLGFEAGVRLQSGADFDADAPDLQLDTEQSVYLGARFGRVVGAGLHPPLLFYFGAGVQRTEFRAELAGSTGRQQLDAMRLAFGAEVAGSDGGFFRGEYALAYYPGDDIEVADGVDVEVTGATAGQFTVAAGYRW